MDELFHLKWDDFGANTSKIFSNHREKSDFFDVTLVSDDMQKISAHKIVLSSSSEYFRKVLAIEGSNDKSLILCINDASHEELSLILDFIYKGEVRVKHENIEHFLQIATRFKLEGLLNQDPPKGEETRSRSINEVEDNKQKKSRKKRHSEIKPKTELIEIKPKHEIEPITELALTDTNVSINNQFGSDNYSQVRALSDKYIETKEDGTFSCSMCGTSGSMKHVIQYHVETHLDGLSFPCSVCDKTFKTRNSQRVHLSLKHRGVANLKQRASNIVRTDLDTTV